MVFIKHSEGKIDSVYDNKKEAQEDIEKKANKKKNNKKKEEKGKSK